MLSLPLQLAWLHTQIGWVHQVDLPTREFVHVVAVIVCAQFCMHACSYTPIRKPGSACISEEFRNILKTGDCKDITYLKACHFTNVPLKGFEKD